MSENNNTIKKDCFGYVEGIKNPHCSALNALYCATEDCKFYKTKEQFEKDLKKANRGR